VIFLMRLVPWIASLLRSPPALVGVLGFRDELISLLNTLDREEFAAARGFFLSAWNGTGGYTFDGIVRGTTHIDAACLSLLGSTQPARISEYDRNSAVQVMRIRTGKTKETQANRLPIIIAARGSS
jgi:hypothetical protein